MSPIFHDIHRMPPVDTRFVAGRWHVDRFAWGGRAAELRVALQSLGGLGPEPRVKFLIVCRARSGSTLLRRLLDSHSRVSCAGELLKQHMLAPGAYLDRVARKSGAEIWGAKLLSYQMVQVHRMHDPVGFLERLGACGFRFVHLERRTLPQTVSLAVAQASSRFHSDRARGSRPERDALDPEVFVARVRWSEALLDYERAIFARLPHHAISYEADLADVERHTETAGRLFDWFGVSREPATTPLRKLLPEDPAHLIMNWDVIAERLRREGLGHLL